MNSKNCVYITDYNRILGIKLYKVHGVLHDYIEVYNGVGRSEVCSLDDFESGRFHIYEKETGREIMPTEIRWR